MNYKLVFQLIQTWLRYSRQIVIILYSKFRVSYDSNTNTDTMIVLNLQECITIELYGTTVVYRFIRISAKRIQTLLL